MSNTFDFDKFEKKYQKAAQEIFEDIFTDATPNNESPKMYLTGGQPGAGKGKLIAKSEKILKAKGISCVIINSDDFRVYHPDATGLFKTHDKYFGLKTADFIRELTFKFVRYAIENKYNIIYESTMRTDDVCGFVANVKNAGYQVHLGVVATNELHSKLGVYGRYNGQFATGEIARFTPQEIHNDAYINMPKTIQRFESEKNFDSLSVYTRTGDLLYCNDKSQGDLCDASHVIEKERNKHWTDKEVLIFQNVVDFETKSMEKRGESQKYIQEVKNFLLSIHRETTKTV